MKESQDEERLGGRVTEAVGKAQHVNDGIYFKLFLGAKAPLGLAHVTVRHSHTKKVLKLLDLATLAKITWLLRGIKEVKNQGLFAGVSSVFKGC